MNKKERNAVCTLIAEWEFNQWGSSSEASMAGKCARDLLRELSISDADMAFYRAWEIGNLIGDQSDETLDILSDAVTEDCQCVLDKLDAGTLAGYVTALKGGEA